MATLLLYKTWLNFLDTDEAVSGWSSRDRQQSHEIDGEMRTYGGGRQRAVMQEGIRGGIAFTMLAVSTSDKDLLRSRVGEFVQYRDTKGERFFGFYFKTPIAEYVGVDLWRVGIDLRFATHTEGV